LHIKPDTHREVNATVFSRIVLFGPQTSLCFCFVENLLATEKNCIFAPLSVFCHHYYTHTHTHTHTHIHTHTHKHTHTHTHTHIHTYTYTHTHIHTYTHTHT